MEHEAAAWVRWMIEVEVVERRRERGSKYIYILSAHSSYFHSIYNAPRSRGKRLLHTKAAVKRYHKEEKELGIPPRAANPISKRVK